MDLGEVVRPTNRSYRLRGTRITEAQEIATQKYWKLFGADLSKKIIPKDYFPNSKLVIMEIGTGMGEATAAIAKEFPDTGFFACEVHRPGIGALLARISEAALTNIRIINDDARIILEHLVPDESFDAFHLYFPDPWRKKKHWKRRIVQSEFIELVAQKLKPDGYIHIATDWEHYAQWIEEKFKASPSFTGGVIARPGFRPLTRFEGQGIRKGHEVSDFKYFKKV